MRVDLEVAGRARVVELEHLGHTLIVRLDGRAMTAAATPVGKGRWGLRFPDTGAEHDVVVVAGAEPGVLDVLVGGVAVSARLRTGPRDLRRGASGHDGPARIAAPMPGKVVKVLVVVGQTVTARQGVVVVEAMKMENELRAGRDGIVREVLVAEGASVEAGTPLVVIE
jgi:biotin carboxyl carrier protein